MYFQVGLQIVGPTGNWSYGPLVLRVDFAHKASNLKDLHQWIILFDSLWVPGSNPGQVDSQAAVSVK